MGSRFDWLYGPNLLRARGHAFDTQIFDLIAERRRPDYRGPRDLLWRLTNTQDRVTGDRLSDQEVRDEAVTLAFGGVDTTMRGFSWVWYLLAMHPWAEARVHAELDEVLGDRTPTPDDLPKLVYLRKVIDESLRLYPAIPVILRTAADDDEVCGHRIRRNTIITVAPWVIHRHQKLWSQPDRFDPERFSPENVATRDRCTYIPFALGPHICIGASLAIMEMMLIAAVLAQRFRFRLAPGYPIDPVGGFLTLRVNGGLFVTVEPRN
jgi:cytochrome P450